MQTPQQRAIMSPQQLEKERLWHGTETNSVALLAGDHHQLGPLVLSRVADDVSRDLSAPYHCDQSHYIQSFFRVS
eukprot:4464012-Amphidinium_carterae.1